MLNNGGTISKVYSIYPAGGQAVPVYCEQTLYGGGWTVSNVITQRNVFGTVLCKNKEEKTYHQGCGKFSRTTPMCGTLFGVLDQSEASI